MKSTLASMLLLLWPAAATAVPATGSPIVYHSPDGQGTQPSSTPFVMQALNDQSLHLFIDYENNPDVGPSSGGTSCGVSGNDPCTMCIDENGDETCAFDVKIELVTDTAVFDSFVPPTGSGFRHTLTSNTLRVNGIDTSGMPIPAEIGTLVVDAAGAKQVQISVTGLHRVGAGGQLDAIQSRVIVPEPGRFALLASGVAALAVLRRLRRMRASAAAR